MNNNTKKDKTIEEYEKIHKRDIYHKIILIIVIIILLVIYFLSYRLGKIGYEEVSTNPDDTIKLIEVTR